MIENRTLQFESARAVQSLYANDLKLLKTLEDALHVKVTTRDGWVKLEGEGEQVDRAQRVFEQLEQARQKGVDIRKHEFTYALNSVAESRPDNLNDVVDMKITTSPRKPPIVARTIGQRNYVEAIQKHDIVFGIGPAGTGKTYLAVAMAVAALKKEQVTRIVLTRPAVEAGEALGFLPGDLQEKITPYLRPLYDSLRDMLDPEETRTRGGAPDHRGRAARLYERSHARQRFCYSRRGAEHDDGTNVHAADPDGTQLQMRCDGRCYANRSAVEQALGIGRGATGSEDGSRHFIHIFQ